MNIKKDWLFYIEELIKILNRSKLKDIKQKPRDTYRYHEVFVLLFRYCFI